MFTSLCPAPQGNALLQHLHRLCLPPPGGFMLLLAELHAETQREDLTGKKSHNISLFTAGTCTHGDELYSPPQHLPLPHALLLQPRERCPWLRTARLGIRAPGTTKEKPSRKREAGRQLLF